MSKQYPGGWISSDPPTPLARYETTPAPGIWTLSQAAEYKALNLWPTAGVVLPDYWILEVNPPTGYLNFQSAKISKIQSDGSFIIGGYVDPNAGATAAKGVIAKSTKNGIISWGAYAEAPTYNQIVNAVTPNVSSSGDIYFGIYNQGSEPMALGAAKLNSTGTSITNLTKAGATDGYLGSLSLDSSNNFYLTGYSPVNSLKAMWVKFNSSGTYQSSDMARTFNSRDYGYYIGKSYIDSSGNTHCFWNNIYEGGYAKLDTSGSPSVCSMIGGGGYNSNVTGYTVERTASPAYFYAAGWAYPDSAAFNLFKVSTSNGTSVSWSWSCSSFSPYNGAQMTTDSSGNNLYLLAYDSTNARSVLMKVNSSGSIQWQRYIKKTGKTTTPFDIEFDNTNNAVIVVLSQSGNPSIPIIMKLPADGSLTGTYGDIEYTASSYTTSSASGSWSSCSSGSATTYSSWSTPSLTTSSFTPKYERDDL